MTSCSRKLLVWTNSLVVVLGLAIIGFGVFVTFSEDGSGVISLIPQVFIYSMFGVGSVIFFVGGLGLFGICARSNCFMYFYIFFTTMTLFLTAILTPFLLLYANDIAVIEDLDNLVSDAQREFEQTTIMFAIEEPAQWKNSQDLLQCCGLSVNAFFFDFSTLEGSVGDVNTGDICISGDGATALANFQSSFPVSNNTLNGVAPEAAVQYVKNDSVLSGGFFCAEALAELLKGLTIPIGVVGGVLAVLQLLNIRAAFVLLYRVTLANGGFVEGYGDDVGSYQPGVPNYGRKQSRLGPLPSEMPQVPKSFQGGGGNTGGSLANRLSSRIKASFDNDFFNPPKAPAGGAGQPNVREDFKKYGNRVSMSLRQMGSDTRSLGNRMSSRFRGASTGGSSNGGGWGQRMSSRFGWGPPPPQDEAQRGGWGGPDV